MKSTPSCLAVLAAIASLAAVDVRFAYAADDEVTQTSATAGAARRLGTDATVTTPFVTRPPEETDFPTPTPPTPDTPSPVSLFVRFAALQLGEQPAARALALGLPEEF